MDEMEAQVDGTDVQADADLDFDIEMLSDYLAMKHRC